MSIRKKLSTLKFTGDKHYGFLDADRVSHDSVEEYLFDGIETDEKTRAAREFYRSQHEEIPGALSSPSVEHGVLSRVDKE